MVAKYKKNYLKQVIVRTDFLNPIHSLNEGLPNEISSVIKDFFPIAEPREVLALDFQISPEVSDKKQTKLMEWNFHGKERDKRLSISEKNMYISFNSYKSFEDLTTIFIKIVDSLFNTFKEMQITRLGLRYTNSINITDTDVFGWKSYLNKDLLSAFNIPDDKTKIARIFHTLELNYGNFNLRFQYGMPNPDFPSPIKKKIFILDYDAYYEGFLKKEEIIENLPIFHSEIQKFFEKSITEKLRKKMNDEK